MSISTSDLLLHLRQASDLLSFFQKYETELIKETPGSCLYALLDKHGLRPGDIAARTGTGNYVDRILTDERTPGRDTVAAFCLAIGSTLSECQMLLRVSRHALLDPRFHRDGALIFALENGIGLSRCNDLLFDIKEDTL